MAFPWPRVGNNKERKNKRREKRQKRGETRTKLNKRESQIYFSIFSNNVFFEVLPIVIFLTQPVDAVLNPQLEENYNFTKSGLRDKTVSLKVSFNPSRLSLNIHSPRINQTRRNPDNL